MAKGFGKYTYPSEIELQRLREESAKRRAALQNAGCSTYTFGLKNSQQAILCLCCGLGSHNLNDIQQKYCGFCHEFHSEWKESDRNV